MRKIVGLSRHVVRLCFVYPFNDSLAKLISEDMVIVFQDCRFFPEAANETVQSYQAKIIIVR